MNILTISGSTRPNSSNSKLLEHLSVLCPEHVFQRYVAIEFLPIFKAENDQHPWQEEVLNWKAALAKSDAVIICTPEYIHNMPALIKNALEWVTSSGEFFQKPVLPITFTPHPPRGEKAMQSLLWSLQALDARIVAELPLYQNEIKFEGGKVEMSVEIEEMIVTAVGML